ncbi:MAG: NAD-dependent epimerase/dehydratase family protein [Candidatus Aminicenantes bacterium]|jgi:dihydroflavonol-4-reductase
MRVFVTGASGFIGRALVEACLQRKWHVRVLEHTQAMEKEGIPGTNYGVFRGDITDPASLDGIFEGVDILFHCAAALGASLLSESDFSRINAAGTDNVLNASKEAGVSKVVHFSSAGVLGSVEKGEVAHEDQAPNPQNSYDRSKLEGENIALRYADEGMDIVIIRPGWVYGPGDRRTFKLIKAIAHRRFCLVTRGDTLQTPVHIHDLVEGATLCAEKGQRGNIYHIAGREVLAVKDIVTAIASATGKKIPPFSLPLLPVKMAASILERVFALFRKEAPLTRGRLSFFIHPKPLAIQKARRELGYVPKVEFSEGISQTVEWSKAHNWL